MKKFLLILVLVAIPLTASAEKPTRLYTPVIKQGSYTTTQTNTVIWDPVPFDHIVMDSYSISSDLPQKITLAASSTIISVHVSASQPIVGNLLWKSPNNEQIVITNVGPQVGNIEVTLTGWEEDN